MFSVSIFLFLATYRCQWEKQVFAKCRPVISNICSWVLLIVIENVVFTGNCTLLNWNGKSVGMIGIRGIKTFFPFTNYYSTDNTETAISLTYICDLF